MQKKMESARKDDSEHYKQIAQLNDQILLLKKQIADASFANKKQELQLENNATTIESQKEKLSELNTLVESLQKEKNSQ